MIRIILFFISFFAFSQNNYYFESLKGDKKVSDFNSLKSKDSYEIIKGIRDKKQSITIKYKSNFYNNKVIYEYVFFKEYLNYIKLNFIINSDKIKIKDDLIDKLNKQYGNYYFKSDKRIIWNNKGIDIAFYYEDMNIKMYLSKVDSKLEKKYLLNSYIYYIKKRFIFLNRYYLISLIVKLNNKYDFYNPILLIQTIKGDQQVILYKNDDDKTLFNSDITVKKDSSILFLYLNYTNNNFYMIDFIKEEITKVLDDRNFKFYFSSENIFNISYNERLFSYKIDNIENSKNVYIDDFYIKDKYLNVIYNIATKNKSLLKLLITFNIDDYSLNKIEKYE